MINDLKPYQDKLDQFIYDTHDIKPKDVMGEKIIALDVELSEMMNEVETVFKYWKVNPKKKHDRALEEFVDVQHFLLSLANDLKIDIQYKQPKHDDMRTLYLGIKNMVTLLAVNPSIYNELFSAIWYLGEKLGFTETEIRGAYERKYEVNVQRQKEKY